jgi:hypothetical protein
MYSLDSYFLSTYFSTTIVNLVYAIISSIICYYFLEFKDNSYKNLYDWIIIIVLQALCGNNFGFFIGCAVNDNISSLLINMYFILLFNFGAGFFANNNTKNYFIKFLSYISPFRYA